MLITYSVENEQSVASLDWWGIGAGGRVAPAGGADV
jgi:hypothetical protein